MAPSIAPMTPLAISSSRMTLRNMGSSEKLSIFSPLDDFVILPSFLGAAAATPWSLRAFPGRKCHSRVKVLRRVPMRRRAMRLSREGARWVVLAGGFRRASQ